VGAALTKPRRVSSSRWRGSGERDEEEYVRNRRCYVLNLDTDSSFTLSVWFGRGASRRLLMRRKLHGRSSITARGGHRERLRRTGDEAARTPSGSCFNEPTAITALQEVTLPFAVHALPARSGAGLSDRRGTSRRRAA